MALAAAPQTFTVIFTVNLSGTSIGAGFRAVRPKLIFRDLSTSIDSHDDRGQHRRHRRRMSVAVKATPKRGRHRTPQATVQTNFFADFFTVTMPHERSN